MTTPTDDPAKSEKGSWVNGPALHPTAIHWQGTP